MEFKGIDVSKWNGNINWDKVKNAGISFAIIREGYGKQDPLNRLTSNLKTTSMVLKA